MAAPRGRMAHALIHAAACANLSGKMGGNMRGNPVRAKLRKGGTAFGHMAFEFFTPGLCQLMANAGAEFCIFDTEHSGAGIETTEAAGGVRARHRACADGARAGLALSPDRAGARCRHDGHHGADGRDRRAGRRHREMVPLPAAGRARARVRHGA